MKKHFTCHHGLAKPRGCGHVAVGGFSRLFPKLDSLAVSEIDAAALGGPGGLMHDFDGASPDIDIPAGYIFFAQFVDHDVTLDTGSKLRGAPLDAKAVSGLGNVRSASLDLDCVYGFGPEGSPHLYNGARPGEMAVGEGGRDLPRSPGGVALIGDPRNDENIFVSQMQLLFHRFHNRLLVERVHQTDGARGFDRFEAAQEEARFHYQWLVLFDFLKRLCDPEVWRFAVGRLLDHAAGFPLCYGLDAHGKLPMPVEFSAAAYRVGHTLVRSRYAVNDAHPDVELFDERFGATGFSALPAGLEVDWKYMLALEPHHRPRMCKAVDPLFADELQNLPVVGSNNPDDRALAFRNLLRGNALGLPSGQDVAKALAAAGYPIAPVDLALPTLPGWWRVERADRASALTCQTPLFYYLMRESEVVHQGRRYGPTGSAILMEVFGGMLRLCGGTFLNHPHWAPDACVARKADGSVQDAELAALVDDPDYYPFELADLARFTLG
ncbi:peroxidase family protein [Rubrimonas cliftonensis]|uniref:Animal haem peroxidase n=1 Tax=Rubrimonas cliftonensis TaxID=89524 RepID=A0A1H3XHN8_9RHOB|nr:heme peroxidase family protein [Rubrimonas cliftonensis]SDZ98461.1 Animal haem peroxidase [Rubrimonas cliftonensis]